MSVYPSGAPCPRGVRFWRLRLTLAATARHCPRVLADALARSRAHDVALVLGGALLTAGLAQVSISVPGSPVPITGQSLGVIVAAAALGPVRGMAAQFLYLLMGAVGLPFFAEGASGLERILGATGGYLVGFVPAAFLVGLAAQRGFDRRPWTALPLFAVGQLAVLRSACPGLSCPPGSAWPRLLASASHPSFLEGSSRPPSPPCCCPSRGGWWGRARSDASTSVPCFVADAHVKKAASELIDR